MVCLDTDILISLLKADSSAVSTIKELENSDDILFSTLITSYELVKGAYISLNSKSNLNLVKNLLNTLNILEMNANSINIAGGVYRDLRKKGKLIGEFDILIASICMANDEILISNDGHFKYVEGLEVCNW
jgi:tRNA(fMet)-specific endonuclease VapC